MVAVQNVRRLVLTGAVVSVTIAGSLYGAGLKTEQEAIQKTQKRQEATIDERISSLQTIRASLTTKKEMVEKQILDLDARIEAKKEKGLDSVNKP